MTVNSLIAYKTDRADKTVWENNVEVLVSVIV